MNLQEFYNHRKPKKLLDQVRDVMREQRTGCRQALISAPSKAFWVITIYPQPWSTPMCYAREDRGSKAYLICLNRLPDDEKARFSLTNQLVMGY